LFNALTSAGVYVEDKLFATLDPTLRGLQLPDRSRIILADTVGFVRDLPHELIAAFRSTLQEAREADLILHLIDASDPNRWQRVRQVNAVLQQLDAAEVPQIRVYNKVDRLEGEVRRNKARHGTARAVWISAMTGQGLPQLLATIGDRLRREKVRGIIRLDAGQGRQRARLFDLGAVAQEVVVDGGWMLELDMDARDFNRFIKRENLPSDILQRERGQIARTAQTQQG
jgi:GTP-binding protein HflX